MGTKRPGMSFIGLAGALSLVLHGTFALVLVLGYLAFVSLGKRYEIRFAS